MKSYITLTVWLIRSFNDRQMNKKLRENNCNYNLTSKTIKYTWTNYFTGSEYYRVFRYSAHTEHRVPTRHSPELYTTNFFMDTTSAKQPTNQPTNKIIN